MIPTFDQCPTCCRYAWLPHICPAIWAVRCPEWYDEDEYAERGSDPAGAAEAFVDRHDGEEGERGRALAANERSITVEVLIGKDWKSFTVSGHMEFKYSAREVT